MSDYLVGLIRTGVMLGIGTVTAWLLNIGVDIDETGLIQSATALFIALYYALVAALERKYPWVGWLLGIPKPPAYGN